MISVDVVAGLLAAVFLVVLYGAMCDTYPAVTALITCVVLPVTWFVLRLTVLK